MDLKKEVKVGDFVQYTDEDGVVIGDDGKLLRVIEIFKHKVFGDMCVGYEDGKFDFLNNVEKADPLLLELI